MPEALNSANFDSTVAKGTTVVDFWASWCGPCRMLAPIFEELSKEVKGVKFAKVDITESEEIAQKYGVMSIPTLIIFKNGKEVDRRMGALPKDLLKKWIESKV